MSSFYKPFTYPFFKIVSRIELCTVRTKFEAVKWRSTTTEAEKDWEYCNGTYWTLTLKSLAPRCYVVSSHRQTFNNGNRRNIMKNQGGRVTLSIVAYIEIKFELVPTISR